jgi:hypothetical protein
VVDSVDDFISEFEEGLDNLFNDSLVGEVLVDGNLEESLNHGSLLNLLPSLLADSGDG